MIPGPDFTSALIADLPRLRRYATALTGDAALADDLMQDCIERALRQAAQLRDIARMSAWLRRILHNLYIDEIRRRQGRGKEEDIDSLADRLELSVMAQDGLAYRDFLKAIGALRFEHRQILLLAGLENLNYREIADELDIPMGTVMSRLARARERLRELMGYEAEANIVPLATRAKDRS